MMDSSTFLSIGVNGGYGAGWHRARNGSAARPLVIQDLTGISQRGRAERIPLCPHAGRLVTLPQPTLSIPSVINRSGDHQVLRTQSRDHNLRLAEKTQ